MSEVKRVSVKDKIGVSLAHESGQEAVQDYSSQGFRSTMDQLRQKVAEAHAGGDQEAIRELEAKLEDAEALWQQLGGGKIDKNEQRVQRLREKYGGSGTTIAGRRRAERLEKEFQDNYRAFRQQAEQSEEVVSSSSAEDNSTEEVSGSQKEMTPEQIALAEIETLKELTTRAREDYAAELARDYGRMLGRFLQNDSGVARFLKKIPGAHRVAEFVDRINNRLDKRQLDENGNSIAQQEYRIASEQLMIRQQQGLLHEMKQRAEQGELTEEEALANFRGEQLLMLTQEDGMLEQAIANQRQAQSKEASWFSNWWVRQEGLSGQIKKAVVAVGAGIVTGAAVTGGAMLFGVAVPTFGLAAAGGLVGGLMARHINQRRANSFVDKDKTITVADREARKQTADAEVRILTSKTDDLSTTARRGMDTIITGAEKNAAESMKNNRRRMQALVGLGATGAKLGGIMVEGMADLFSGDKVGALESGADMGTDSNESSADTSAASGEELSSNNPSGNETSSADISSEDISTAAETPTSPEVTINGNEFMVEPGSGLTQELQQFAEINGKSLTPEQAWQLHNDLINQYGGSYIEGGTYWEGGDLRISSPGMTSFKDGAAEFAMEWMKQRGL